MNKTTNIQYSGFHPSEWTESYVESAIARMQELAPYGAVIRASFRRKDADFTGMIQINSSVGSFFAKSQSKKIREVCSHLNDQILHQLGKWKQSRLHGRESIRHPADVTDFDKSSA